MPGWHARSVTPSRQACRPDVTLPESRAWTARSASRSHRGVASSPLSTRAVAAPPRRWRTTESTEDRYGSDAEMFDLVHAMRTRVITSPAFDGSRILAAILFEQTMDREINGVPTAAVPVGRQARRTVPEGRQGPRRRAARRAADEADRHARRPAGAGGRAPMFGTKMRSVIKDADEDGVRRSSTSSSSTASGSARPVSSRSSNPRSASTARTRTRPRRCCTTRSQRTSMRCPPTRRSCSS